MEYYILRVAENDGESIAVADPLFNVWSEGERFAWPAGLDVVTQQKGKPYDWIGGCSWGPYVKRHVRSRLESLGEDVQWHGPFNIRGESYFLFNCVRLIDCTLPGSDSNKLFLDHDKIAGTHVFRPTAFRRRLIVSAEFKLHLLAAGETGVRFGRIRPDGWEEFPF